MSSRCPDSGKRGYPSYGEALDALIELEQRSPRPGVGSAYHCSRCDSWHNSSRKFTIAKRRGRGTSRRGLVDEVG
jgi:hypothetical protein